MHEEEEEEERIQTSILRGLISFVVLLSTLTMFEMLG